MGYADHSLGRFMDAVAARRPAPGGGAVAAMTVAAAAGLTAMTARYSERFDGAGSVLERAEELRRRVTGLADADARAYAEVLAAFQARHEDDDDGARVRAALQSATEIPLAVVDCARQVAVLAAPLVTAGNPNLRGDALTAVFLAEAAAVSAAQLVRINTRLGDLDDEPVQTADIWCAEARNAARRVGSRS